MGMNHHSRLTCHFSGRTFRLVIFLFLSKLILETEVVLIICLSSIAMKRQHYHGNSFKGKLLIGASLPFQRLSLLLSWEEAWWPLAYGFRAQSNIVMKGNMVAHRQIRCWRGS